MCDDLADGCLWGVNFTFNALKCTRDSWDLSCDGDLSVPIGLTFQFVDHSFAMLLTGPESIDQSRVRHGSVQTTERYLGCTQRIVSAVNGRIGIEPKREASGPEQWPTSRSNIDRRKGFVGTDLLNFRKSNCGRKHPRLTLRPGNQFTSATSATARAECRAYDSKPRM